FDRYRAGCCRSPQRTTGSNNTLRSAQVRRISWVRGVRPAVERHRVASSNRSPPATSFEVPYETLRAPRGALSSSVSDDAYLIFVSTNSTCFFAIGSYFRFFILSVIVREFF